MCRWIAYSGQPILLEDLLYRPAHSLIDQSQNSRLGVETTNGDGFGVGWFSEGKPGTFHSANPAWNDHNLRSIAGHIRAPILMAHVRASTGSPVHESNCHPFEHGGWLWMHNGAIADFGRLKRDLVLAVAPDLYPSITGSTDSELMFYLALTFGLREDPPGAVARMAGLVEAVAAAHGVPDALQMTIATSEGERLWAFRYSTPRDSRSLFYSTDVGTLRRMHPDNDLLRGLSDDARLVVSEPLGDLKGAWNEVPEGAYGVVTGENGELHPFVPVAP
jgi:predicted glutamine amidotransferase